MSSEPNCLPAESNCTFCPEPNTTRMACVSAYESSSGPGWAAYAHPECAAVNSAPVLYTVDTNKTDRQSA
ncbi:hypothetical protein ACIQMR_22035 [Streptomyces sp. NPDC091376]|uniref:hypothetical protein n=1 Tax=Streptomyces sp. NPDC091376 TaxID=3365994 RepID=UPI00383054E8